MLSQYFGFREDPFGVTPDHRFLYESPTHGEALASLKYGILSSRGFVTLIAPPGMGKTTILMRFLRDISRSARTAFLFDVDPNCTPRDVISYVLRDLGVKPGKDSAEMHEQLKTEVTWEAKAGRSLVVVVDEAQNLSETSLEVVRTLTNFETPRSKMVQVVLAGQPQLSDMLSRPSLEQLRQRITTFCRIEPLNMEQRVAYIEHRLRFVGYSGPPLFSGEALKRILEASEGTPRVINNVCWNSLSLCCALQQKQVDGRMVSEALRDLQMLKPTLAPELALAPAPTAVLAQVEPKKMAARTPWKSIAAVLFVLVTLNVFGLLHIWRHSVAPPSVRDSSPKAAFPATPQLLRPNAPSPSEKTPLSIVVKRNESLRDLSLRYLGEFNRSRIQQIMKLNPSVTDPNRILEGQTILLPPRD